MSELMPCPKCGREVEVTPVHPRDPCYFPSSTHRVFSGICLDCPESPESKGNVCYYLVPLDDARVENSPQEAKKG